MKTEDIKTEENRKFNKARTKKEILKNVFSIEDKGKKILEADKQRVNISINGALWQELDCKNKSELMEELLRKYLSKQIGTEIVLRKPF